MEIHKPKSIHGWGDFLKELGTIVLGIAIAISLEQLVERWHWDNEVKIARQAIAGEITANNANQFVFRIATAPCVERQLRDADTVLTSLEAGGKPAKGASISEAPGSPLRDSEWQSERASQVLTHFPRDELALMGRYYGQLDEFRRWMDREEDIWQELRTLQKPPAGITVSDLIRLRVQLGLARRTHTLIVINALRQLRLSKQLGIAAPQADPIQVKNYCTMSLEDYLRYMRSRNFR